jgi:hypothetical protein
VVQPDRPRPRDPARGRDPVPKRGDCGPSRRPGLQPKPAFHVRPSRLVRTKCKSRAREDSGVVRRRWGQTPRRGRRRRTRARASRSVAGIGASRSAQRAQRDGRLAPRAARPRWRRYCIMVLGQPLPDASTLRLALSRGQVILTCPRQPGRARRVPGLAEARLARRGPATRASPSRRNRRLALRASLASAPSHSLQEAGKQTPQDAHKFCSMILRRQHPAVCTWGCHGLSYLDRTRQQGRARLAWQGRLRG